MKKLFLIVNLTLVLSYCYSQIYPVKVYFDTLSIIKLKELEPKIEQINKNLDARLDNFTPDYSKWNMGNYLLQNFVSNQELNLWDGKYIRGTSLHSLFKEHKHRIIVNIKYPWMDTGIDLIEGKQYYLVSGGLASTSNSKLALWIGPEGKEYQLNGLPMYSLIGKIGEKNQPFYIGKEIEILPKTTQRLYIGYNDDLFMDNIGYYIIDIFELTKNETIQKLDSINVSLGSYYAE